MKKYQLTAIAMGVSLIAIPAFTNAQVPPPKVGGEREGFNRPTMMNRDFASTTRPFIGSSTRPMMGRDFSSSTRREMMRDFASSTSSTTPWGNREDKRERIDQRRNELRGNGRELRIDIFKLQQNNIINQLSRALDNLRQVGTRIDARITKAEQDGKDMTSVKALLVTADSKIAVASTSIDSFASINSSSTTNIQLDRPRQIASSSIAAIKDAKTALTNVVTALAQSLGVNIGDQHQTDNNGASSTEPVACTQDARMCPDGSYVGRTGPRCEFKACPGAPIGTSTEQTN